MTRSSIAAKPWRPAETRRVIAARTSEGLDWEAIGRELGRSALACKVHFNIAQRTARGQVPKPSIAQLATRREERRIAATAAAIRAAAPVRSLTAEVFGDPLPGRSALDRRRNEGAQPR